jgi:hypothetical protein
LGKILAEVPLAGLSDGKFTIGLYVRHQGRDVFIAVGHKSSPLHLGIASLAECLEREAVVASVSLALRDGLVHVTVGVTNRLLHGAAPWQRSERFDI